MKDSEILWAARDNVERGWCQGAYSAMGNVCAAGAIGDAVLVFCGATMAHHMRRFDLMDHLRDTLDGQSALTFNDHPDTTKQDVLDLFEKTAIRLEESGQ